MKKEKQQTLRVYMMRHAVAVKSGTRRYADDDRPLTQRGVADMKRAACGLRQVIGSCEEIVSSPLPRALQTAEIVAAALGIQNKLKKTSVLLPGSAMRAFARLMVQRRGRSSLFLVGHEPDLSMRISYLIGVDEQVVTLKKGSLCRIDVVFEKMRPQGRIAWLLSCKHLCMFAES